VKEKELPAKKLLAVLFLIASGHPNAKPENQGDASHM